MKNLIKMNMLHNKGFDIFPTSLNMGGSSDFLLLFFFCLIVLTSWAKLQSPIEQNFVLILFSFLSLRNTSFDNGDRSDRKPRKLAVAFFGRNSFYRFHGIWRNYVRINRATMIVRFWITLLYMEPRSIDIIWFPLKTSLVRSLKYIECRFDVFSNSKSDANYINLCQNCHLVV